MAYNEMAGIYEVVCRSALQLGLGYTPGLTAPRKARGKASRRAEPAPVVSSHAAPSAPLRLS